MLWIVTRRNMNPKLNEISEGIKQQRPVPTVSAVFDNGAILEMVYHPAEKRTSFVFWKDGEWKLEPALSIDPFRRLVPYSPNNNLIRNEVVLLPSQPEEYGSEEGLLDEIQSFIHRYVDVSPLFEKIASYYPGHRRRDDQLPIGDPPPKRGPKRVAPSTTLTAIACSAWL